MGFSRRCCRRHCYSVFDSELTILHNPGNPAAGNEIRFHHPLHFWKVIGVESPSMRPPQLNFGLLAAADCSFQPFGFLLGYVG